MDPKKMIDDNFWKKLKKQEKREKIIVKEAYYRMNYQTQMKDDS